MGRASKGRDVAAVTPAVILVRPQLGENIGMAARAMGNFALSRLRIVNPRDGWPNEKALATSSGAHWILDRASVHWTMEDALKDVNYVYATTARPRGMVKEVITPEQAAAAMRSGRGRGVRIFATIFMQQRSKC